MVAPNLLENACFEGSSVFHIVSVCPGYAMFPLVDKASDEKLESIQVVREMQHPVELGNHPFGPKGQDKRGQKVLHCNQQQRWSNISTRCAPDEVHYIDEGEKCQTRIHATFHGEKCLGYKVAKHRVNRQTITRSAFQMLSRAAGGLVLWREDVWNGRGVELNWPSPMTQVAVHQLPSIVHLVFA